MIFWEFGESNPLEGFILPGALEQPCGPKPGCGGFCRSRWGGEADGALETQGPLYPSALLPHTPTLCPHQCMGHNPLSRPSLRGPELLMPSIVPEPMEYRKDLGLESRSVHVNLKF